MCFLSCENGLFLEFLLTVHWISVTINVSIVESMMKLMKMMVAIDSRVPIRFRAGFSFTFHYMESTNGHEGNKGKNDLHK